MKEKYITLQGGLDEVTRGVDLAPGTIIRCRNIECKESVGYRKMAGYTKFDDAEVPGEGDILGVWGYSGKGYAFRNETGGATAAMYESSGNGWTAKKTGLPPNGNYQFTNEHIAGSQMMYGASGVHKLFQWDGTTFTLLTTGMTIDTPHLVIGFKKHLFAASGSDILNSSLGDPTTWSAITGAAQIRTESQVTGLQRMTGGRLGVFSRNSVSILEGSISSEFIMTNMSQHGNNMGSIAGSLQQMGSRVYYMDDIGVMDFYTSQRFGDFQDATLSQKIRPTIEAKKDAVVASCIIKNKTQYRIFFSDKTGIIATFNGSKLKGWTKFRLPLQVKTICNTEDSRGNEKIYFGSTDGYVYELESGSSFDNVQITSYMMVSPSHLGTPFKSKRFRRAQFDLQTGGIVKIQVKPVFFSGNKPNISYEDMTVSGAADSVLGSMPLGAGVLGGSDLVNGILDMPGTGEYVGLHVKSDYTGAILGEMILGDNVMGIDGSWEIDGINYQFGEGRRKRN